MTTSNGKCYMKIFICITIFLFIIYLLLYNYSSFFRIPPSSETYSKYNVRIYCFILTAPSYFDTRARAVNQTWAPRCDGYSFISEYSNDTKGLPIAPIADITSGYGHLTQKSTLALHYIYKRFLNDYQWFVKADDNTYLFVENLKLFLKDKKTSDPITYGYNFKLFVRGGYHSGGAAYVLSREAVKRFYQAHHKPNTTCAKDDGAEDVEIAKCLRTVDVYPGRSTDSYNRERFHVLSFNDHYIGPIPQWLYTYAQNRPMVGRWCCSNTTISFHYVTPQEQYLIDKVRYGFNDAIQDYRIA